jgi:hypothetical protein
MKRSEHPRLHLELGMLKTITKVKENVETAAFVETNKIHVVETKTVDKPYKKVEKLEPINVEIPSPKVETLKVNKVDVSEPEIKETVKKEMPPLNNSAIVDLETIKDQWVNICEKVREKSLFTEPLITCAKIKDFENNLLTLGYEKENKFQMEQIKDTRFKRNVEEVLNEFFNIPITITAVKIEQELKKAMNSDDVLNDPLVKKVVEMFNGKITSRKNK